VSIAALDSWVSSSIGPPVIGETVNLDLWVSSSISAGLLGVAGGTAYTWTTTAGAFVLSGKPIVQRVARPDTTRRDPTRPDAT